MKTINHYTQEGLNALIGSKLDPDGIIGKKSTEELKRLYTRLQQYFIRNEYRWGKYNVIGIRMSDEYTNKFTDWLIFTKNESLIMIPFSTKPGWSYVKNKQYIEDKKGCAVLKEGQYKDFWALGKTGWTGKKYLQQVGKCDIYRDADLDGFIDRENVFTGNYGINFHSWKGFIGTFIQNLSAGCQVTQSQVHDLIFPYLEMALAEDSLLDYTLIHIDQF